MLRKNKDKIKLALIFGGESSEREVSLKSGENIFNHLNKEKYIIKKYDPKFDLKKLVNDSEAGKIDVAFLALHGKFGEDGTIQGLLELLNIPYVGSGVSSSVLAMDKILSKQIFYATNIPTPKFLYFSQNDLDQKYNIVFNKIKTPCIVKPSSAGSSLGITVVKDKKKLKEAIELAFVESPFVLVEEFILGKELSVPILDQQALPVVEINTTREFFDYKAKYDSSFSEEIIPANISEELRIKVQNLALEAHNALGCRHFSRVDMILDQNNQAWVLEVNTLPGMTINSIYPKSAKVAGIDFSILLDKLINLVISNI